MNNNFKILKRGFLDIHSENIYAQFQSSKLNGVVKIYQTKINKENIRKKSKRDKTAMNKKFVKSIFRYSLIEHLCWILRF